MSASLIIPARNAQQALGRLLDALKPQIAAHSDIEVVVVDSGSRDRTASIARAAGVAVVRSGRGASVARNAGIAATSGDLVIFLDSDCIPRAEWLDRLLAPMADPAVGAAGGHVAPVPPENLIQRHAALTDHVSQEVSLGDLYMPYLITANCCYRRQVLERLGGFDETLVCGEDADLTWRAVRDLGTEIAYAPDAIVEHVHRTNLRDLWAQWKKYGWGEMQLQSRYGVWVGARPDGQRPVRRALSDLARSGSALSRLPFGRATALDVVSPLLRSYERIAARAGRLAAGRARRRGLWR